jgi:signal transduction histidine kinase
MFVAARSPADYRRRAGRRGKELQDLASPDPARCCFTRFRRQADLQSGDYLCSRICMNAGAMPMRPVGEKSARAGDERLAVLAHELRTPLSALASAAEVLARCASEPSMVRISQIVSRQTATMRALVEQLLDASRVDTGRLALRMCMIDLRDVARNAVDDHREQLARAGLHCELSLHSQPIRVNGDAVKLGQVLGNLLSNAIKFTPAPGSVHIAVEASGDFARLSVRDTGIGLSADLLPVIFDQYCQANRGSFGGLGLGLPIAKGLVDLHGGEIRAVSDGPGTGCTITVALPLAKECATMRGNANDESSSAGQ